MRPFESARDLSDRLQAERYLAHEGLATGSAGSTRTGARRAVNPCRPAWPLLFRTWTSGARVALSALEALTGELARA